MEWTDDLNGAGGCRSVYLLNTGLFDIFNVGVDERKHGIHVVWKITHMPCTFEEELIYKVDVDINVVVERFAYVLWSEWKRECPLIGIEYFAFLECVCDLLVRMMETAGEG